MKKIFFLLFSLSLTMSMYSQDGLVYWSQSEGYSFDFDLDGKIDLTLPTQTKDRAISDIYVFDANGDGHFDLCEVDLNDALIKWIFYYNDGSNNFVDPQEVIYGMSVGDKRLSGDFNGDGIGDVAIRRDNEWGLWWLMHFMAMAPDVNLQFGISDKDILLAGDMNGDGQDDVVCYDKGSWLCSFTPSTTEYKTPDFAVKDIEMKFGTSYDIPVLGDFDGDGYDDMGLCSVDDGEVSINFHNSATKKENGGYSNNGKGSFDKTILMPAGITPTHVCSVKKTVTSAVQSVMNNKSVKVYPNWVKAGAEVKVSCKEIVSEVQVYNTMGQLVKVMNTAGENEITLPTQGWNTGTYIVCVKSGNEMNTSKIVVF